MRPLFRPAPLRRPSMDGLRHASRLSKRTPPSWASYSLVPPRLVDPHLLIATALLEDDRQTVVHFDPVLLLVAICHRIDIGVFLHTHRRVSW